MEKTEIIVGDLMARHVDRLNWQLFERREIKASNNPNTNVRAGEVDWVALPAYFGTLGSAIERMRAMYRERGLDASELRDAVKQLEKLDGLFMRELNKSLKGVVA